MSEFCHAQTVHALFPIYKPLLYLVATAIVGTQISHTLRPVRPSHLPTNCPYRNHFGTGYRSQTVALLRELSH